MFSPDAFTADFVLPATQPPPPEDPPPETPPDDVLGPWISEGTVHTGHKPNH